MENITPIMTTCPICNVPVREDRVGTHKRKAHRKSKFDLEPCPLCKAEVRTDRLDKHLEKVHGKPSPSEITIRLRNDDFLYLYDRASADDSSRWEDDLLDELKAVTSFDLFQGVTAISKEIELRIEIDQERFEYFRHQAFENNTTWKNIIIEKINNIVQSRKRAHDRA